MYLHYRASLKARDFQVAFVLSVAFHAALFFLGPAEGFWKSFLHDRREAVRTPEITYQSRAVNAQRLTVQDHAAIPEERIMTRKEQGGRAVVSRPPIPENKPAAQPAQRPVVRAEAYHEAGAVARPGESKYAADEMGGADPKNAAFYRAVVKAKIERELDEKGGAYYRHNAISIRFSILPDGSISDLAFLDPPEKRSRVLEQIVMQSIRAAAPFPPFPKEIDRDKILCKYNITFNP